MAKNGWERAGGKVIGHFTPREIRWFHRHLLRFRHQMRFGHARVAATSPEFLVQTRSAVDTALATLPERGGRTIELRGRRQVLAWVWALHEYRLSLAGERTASLARTRAEREERIGMVFDCVTRWLSRVADELVVTADVVPDHPDGE